MSPAFIRGVGDCLPQPHKFHDLANAAAALDQTRRLEQRRNPSLKDCAGNCSKTAGDCLLKHAPTSMP
jgi:hypothetical protein